MCMYFVVGYTVLAAHTIYQKCSRSLWSFPSSPDQWMFPAQQHTPTNPTICQSKHTICQSLEVSDTLRQVTPLLSTLDHCLEICKLIKFSPRRDAIFTKIKAELTPQVPGLRNLCPARWTFRGTSLESILLNYPSLLATWEEATEPVKQTHVKARISGVASKMMEFNFFFFYASWTPAKALR